MREQIEQKIKEIVDWREVDRYLDCILYDIRKIKEHKLDFTGDIKWAIGKLEDIFSEAEDIASRQILLEEEEENG